MNLTNAQKAKRIISEVIYVTVASASLNGQPWNSPVFAAYDENFNFYWTSSRDSEHSKNIKENPRIFLVIYNSMAPETTGEGVYIQAMGNELEEEKEISAAYRCLNQRSKKMNILLKDFLDPLFPLRLYGAKPLKMWINIDVKEKNCLIDKRAEVKLV